MNTQGMVNIEWVCSEGTVKEYSKRVGNDGGKVVSATPFVPRPEEADLYSDAQFEPLVVVGAVVATVMAIRYVRELILDLKGREVAIVDCSKDPPQVRVVPIGKASQVILKGADGSVEKFEPNKIDKIEKNLTTMFQPG